MQFGHYLKENRNKLGWTQPDAASKIGIEQSYLSKLETGKSLPSEEIFDKIRDVYKFEMSEMVESVQPSDLDKLTDVSVIKSAVHTYGNKQQKLKRRWLLLGLLMLMLGSALVSTHYTSIPGNSEYWYTYNSSGLIKEGENLDVYELLNGIGSMRSSLSMDELLAVKKDLYSRLDPIELKFENDRGQGYIEQVDGGIRFFKKTRFSGTTKPLFPKWLVVPGYAFLIGGLACFLIARMWHKPRL